MTTAQLGSETVLTVTDLSSADAARLDSLAKSFRGRWVPALSGYAMRPSFAERVEALWTPGFTAVRRGSVWKFHRYGDERKYDQYEAVRLAKEVVCSQW